MQGRGRRKSEIPVKPMAITAKDVGTAIRALRERLGLSQRMLAREVGISSSSMNAIENGTTFPSLITLYEIGWHLDFSFDRFFDMVEEASLEEAS